MKQLLVFLFLLCSASVFAQDVIVKKDGSTIVCRVVELTSSEIVYKKWSDLNGSNYVMNRADASAINYQDGKKVNLSEVTNLYKPHNQNDGTQQYNDRALLLLDKESNMTSVKTTNAFKYTGGGLLLGGCAIFAITSIVLYAGYNEQNSNVGAGTLALGVSALCGWGGFALIKSANNARKRYNSLQTASLFQQTINISHTSSLLAGVDIIRDNVKHTSTMGLGLRYNF